MQALEVKKNAMFNTLISFRKRLYGYTTRGVMDNLKSKIFEKIHEGIGPHMKEAAKFLYDFFMSVRLIWKSYLREVYFHAHVFVGSLDFKSIISFTVHLYYYLWAANINFQPVGFRCNTYIILFISFLAFL